MTQPAPAEYNLEDRNDVMTAPDLPPHRNDVMTAMSYLTRPRGGSKTSDLAGVAIALMLQAPESTRSYAFAADREQAGLLMDGISGFLGRTPEVRGALEVENWKVTNAETDARLQIMSSDEASAWGLRLGSSSSTSSPTGETPEDLENCGEPRSALCRSGKTASWWC